MTWQIVLESQSIRCSVKEYPPLAQALGGTNNVCLKFFSFFSSKKPHDALKIYFFIDIQ